MAHGVLALGAAAVTAAGSVWYVPALTDLRAGADRPLSRQIAAASCVTAWGTGAVLALVLLLTDPWWAPAAVAAAGAVAAALLRIRAFALHRAEAEETRRQWRQLAPSVPVPTADRSRHGVALLVGTGLAAAAVTAVVRLTTAGVDSAGDRVAAVTAPALVLALFLALAAMHTRTTARSRPPRHRERTP